MIIKVRIADQERKNVYITRKMKLAEFAMHYEPLRKAVKHMIHKGERHMNRHITIKRFGKHLNSSRHLILHTMDEIIVHKNRGDLFEQEDVS